MPKDRFNAQLDYEACFSAIEFLLKTGLLTESEAESAERGIAEDTNPVIRHSTPFNDLN